MSEKIPKATHTGKLTIGDSIIPCAVLDNGMRVLSEHGITTAFGSRSGASKRFKRAEVRGGAPMPVFIASRNILPFISEELSAGLMYPVIYEAETSSRKIEGFPAGLLPKICDVWLTAREKGAIKPQQMRKCQQAEVLMRAFAHVGIIALVDEATGYQAERDRNELHRILEAYIAKELMPWTKKFPDDFYRHLFRLRGWQYSPVSVKRPIYVGKLTEELIYKQLPPGVLEKLKEENPKNAKGRRKHKHFQFLTDDVGDPHLQKQIVRVVTLMQISRNWRAFKTFFAQAHPGPVQEDMFPETEESQTATNKSHKSIDS